MFSIQQLLKTTTRKLPVNNVNIGSADLVKSRKCAAVASGQPPPLWLEMNGASFVVEDDVPTTSGMSSSLSPSLQQQSNQREQQTNAVCRQQQHSADSAVAGVNRKSQRAVSELSQCSQLNENGATQRTTTAVTTQNPKLNNTTAVIEAATTTTIKTKQYSCNRSQQIQNFYQQQLHQFHTQHNQSLWAKQKQTHFTMSSMAAAEPLSSLASAATVAAAIASNGEDSVKLNGDNAATAEKSISPTAAKSGDKPCFKSGFAEILQFMELIGNLKHTKRTGWVLRDVNDCESISAHMYRMSMMTFLLDGSEGLNQIRCMELALVHDLAESIVGDLTPFCGISKEEKRAMEFKAMDDICKLIEPRGKRIMELFQEYESGVSEESKFVKDLDRLDMIMQAFEYEKRDNCLLKHQEFFNSTRGKFKHPFVRQLVEEIYEQRDNLAKERGATPPPHVIEVPEWELPTAHTSNGHCANVPARDRMEEEEEEKINTPSSSSSS